MTLSRIDWVVMWKLFHYQFFCTHLAIGIPLRLVAARSFGPASASKTSLSVVVTSFASSIFSTWLPVVPVICGGVLAVTVGVAYGESFLIGVPLVAVSMGIETAFLDAVLFRVLLKESIKKRLGVLLVANTLNAAIAFAVLLAWASHHMPIFIAAGES
jgi:hypothetical protein